MSALEHALSEARSLGIVLSRNDDRLRVDAPKGSLTTDLRSHLVAHKSELLAIIDAAASDEPFDVCDPNFVEIVLQWRDRVSKPKTVALELPGMSR